MHKFQRLKLTVSISHHHRKHTSPWCEGVLGDWHFYHSPQFQSLWVAFQRAQNCWCTNYHRRLSICLLVAIVICFFKLDWLSFSVIWVAIRCVLILELTYSWLASRLSTANTYSIWIEGIKRWHMWTLLLGCWHI